MSVSASLSCGREQNNGPWNFECRLDSFWVEKKKKKKDLGIVAAISLGISFVAT